MTRIMLLSLRVRFVIFANRLIHFLRRIPLVKKVASPSLYGNYDLKTIFTVLGVLFLISKRIMYRMLYAGFVTAIGLLAYQISIGGGFADFFGSEEISFVAMNAKEAVAAILTVWFMMSFIGAFIGARVVSSSHHEQDKVMVNYMRTKPALYAKAGIVLARITDLLLYFPYLAIAFAIGGIPLWGASVMLLVFTAFRLLGEVVNLWMYRHCGRHFGTMLFWTLAGIPILIAAIIVPVEIGKMDWTRFLQNPLVILGAMALGVLAWLYIRTYPLYAPLLRERLAYYSTLVEKIEKSSSKSGYVNLQSAKNWSKDLAQEDLHSEKFENKTGFAYLNAIFFDRHSKFFRKKLLMRLAGILVVGIALSVFAIWHALENGKPLMGLPQEMLVLGVPREMMGENSIFGFAPVMFFVIYLISMGRVVTAGAFSNCDIQMLHYPYYRTKETIFASFKARFMFILRYNILITTVLSVAAIAVIGILTGYVDYLRFSVLFLLLTCIGIFFAFNDLFLYYVIQPYDTAGKSKSMVYSVINGVIYFIAYMSLQIRFDFFTYSIIMIVATILYLGIGRSLLSVYAPTNFKLR